MFSGKLTYTVVPCAHTVVVCVVVGGDPDKHGAPKVVFQWFFEVNLPTRWFRVPTQWLCVLMGGGPDKHGALKVVFQYCFQVN